MKSLRLWGVMIVLGALSACGISGVNTRSYPGRIQLQFMSADQITVMSYACVSGNTERQTQSRGASAHAYVDDAIRSAQARYGMQGGALSGTLAGRAELNAEIARISQTVDAEYRCAFMGAQNSSIPFGYSV